MPSCGLLVSLFSPSSPPTVDGHPMLISRVLFIPHQHFSLGGLESKANGSLGTVSASVAFQGRSEEGQGRLRAAGSPGSHYLTRSPSCKTAQVADWTEEGAWDEVGTWKGSLGWSGDSLPPFSFSHILPFSCPLPLPSFSLPMRQL